MNTDTQVMQLFLSKLAMELDRDRRGWRQDTVLLLDGARYHTNEEMQKYLKRMDIPVIYTGPNSYDVAPCELFFAHLKSGDLNPLNLPASKR